MNISKLHIITDDLTVIEQACSAGADWIQLRVKDKSLEEIEIIAIAAWEICNSYGATFILNDYVELAKKVQADGVHLGKKDTTPSKARKILGPDFIIGGTANTMEDIKAIQEQVNYIGLGPFRFTETKKNLSPVLDLDGYQNLTNTTSIPIIAIGGITQKDVGPLLRTGVHGVAVSGSIAKAPAIPQSTELFLKELEYATVNYC